MTTHRVYTTQNGYLTLIIVRCLSCQGFICPNCMQTWSNQEELLQHWHSAHDHLTQVCLLSSNSSHFAIYLINDSGLRPVYSWLNLRKNVEGIFLVLLRYFVIFFYHGCVQRLNWWILKAVVICQQFID